MRIDGNTIYLDLANSNSPLILIDYIKTIIRRNERHVVIDCSEVTSAYPNACAPVAAVLDYLRSLQTSVEVVNLPEFAKNVVRIHEPLAAETEVINKEYHVKDRLWTFSNHIHVKNLLDAVIEELSELAKWPNGFIDAVGYTCTEVMGNVLDHAEHGHIGYYMCQMHRDRFVACIADQGQGIRQSFSGTRFKPTSDVDAITLALRHGVTRTQESQGKGLWALDRITTRAGGNFRVRSGQGEVQSTPDGLRPRSSLSWVTTRPGTSVDFQIPASLEIDVAELLGSHKFSMLDIVLSQGESTGHVIDIAETRHGTGTRQAGKLLRNKILNTLRAGMGPIVLNFNRCLIVSSSFADECIGKLMHELGIVGFNRAIRLDGLREDQESIVHQAVVERLSTED